MNTKIPTRTEQLAVYREIFGPARFGPEGSDETAGHGTEFERGFNEYMLRNVGTGPWTANVLTRQQLSIATLSLTAAMGRYPQFETHFRLALKNQWIPLPELSALMLHLAMYCGIPVGSEIFSIARRVLAELNMDMPSA